MAINVIIVKVMSHKLEKETVLAFITQAAEPISLSLIRVKIGDIPPRTLRRWLSGWVELGIIEKFGQGRSTF